MSRQLVRAWAGFIHDGAPGWAPLPDADSPDGFGELGVFGGTAPFARSIAR